MKQQKLLPQFLICFIFSTFPKLISGQSPKTNDAIGGLIFQPDDNYDEIIQSTLRSLKVNVQIVDGVGHVTMTQEFQTPSFFPITNSSKNPTAMYQLPLDELAAVTEFRAEYDNRVITAIVKERKEARKDFDDAVNQGKTAYLAEQSRADIFLISVGNLPRDEIVRVTLVYVTTLEAISSDTLRFVFPTAVAPRYEPFLNNTEGSIPDGLDLMNEGVQIGMSVDMAVPLVSVESPTHDIQVDMIKDETNSKGKTAQVVVVDEDPQERDLVVYITSQSNNEPQIYVESSAMYNSTALMLSIVPGTSQDMSSNTNIPSEYIFVIDQSGSMAGEKIEQVRQAMLLILKQLPSNSFFNIIGFGDSFEAIFTESRSIANTDAKQSAVQYVQNMDADFGGTEILKPLQHILRVKNPKHDQRTLFVLTDGQVSNTQDVIQYVTDNAARASNTRVFSLGIGEHVSALLVRGLARAGRGTAAFVDGNDASAIEEAVQRQMAMATRGALEDVVIEWGDGEAEEKGGTQAPFMAPVFFLGRRFLIYYLIDGDGGGNGDGGVLPDVIRLRSRVSRTDEPVEYIVRKDAFVNAMKVYTDDSDSTVKESTLIHKMAVRSLIRDLEEGTSKLHADGATNEDIREQIVHLGVKYQIASSETSFIAVDNFNWTGAGSGSETYYDPGGRAASGMAGLLSISWYCIGFVIFLLVW
eukprot:CAMPEP_0172479762 /NCGR_PEP_ID=MMETSP1066-20121228/4557_1 /TAXON_ID=671091 /ORGANISM="Coscinodiscus wailesii, Strain CCMP2513" /LENGTH=695 /DNA_ID=CAMNT_0013240519 /DNA_START=67 /DNA_END=2154 /DNA_ORIENTATION=+